MSNVPNPHDLYAGSEKNDDEGKLTRFSLLLRSGHTVSASLPEPRVEALQNQVAAAIAGTPGAGGPVIELPRAVVALDEVAAFVRVTARSD